MDTKVLENIGLTGNEAIIYLALLELGSTTAGPIIKKVGMHRATVYDNIDLLIDKGIVSFVIKANRKYFEAQDPDRLLEYLETKKVEIDAKQAELRDVLPKLHMIRKLAHVEQEANIYKGKKGLKSIFEDILKQKKDMLVFGASGSFKDVFGPYFTNFSDRRARLKIPLKIIFSDKIRKEKREEELKLASIRYLSDTYTTPSTIYVYADRVATIIWSDEPMAFLMKSKKVADSYRTYFELMWKMGKS